MMTKCDMGGGSKNPLFRVTYFLHGPYWLKNVGLFLVRPKKVGLKKQLKTKDFKILVGNRIVGLDFSRPIF